jgi:hypothetical protein
MAGDSTDLALEFSPFYAVLHDGADRLIEFLKKDPFTFAVNGSEFASTVAEAISLSPKIFEALGSNPLGTVFEFPRDSVDPTEFGYFLAFVRRRDFPIIPPAHARSFLSICRHLGCEPLSLALLASIGALTGSSPSASAFPSQPFFDATVDACAARFHSYSADELRLIDAQTLHRLLSSDSLSIESEDWLLRLLLDLDLGDHRIDLLSHIEVSLLSAEGVALFFEEVGFDDVSEVIWSKVVSRLKGGSSDSPRWRRNRLPFESLIVREFPPLLADIRGKSWTLLCRGSRDGFRASNFHAKCDGRSPTVTLIESTKGFVFGGFTPVAWESPSSASYKPDNNRKSFLFTLKSPRGSEARKFGMASTANAIYCNSSYGPTFGNGHDICVADAGNTNRSSYTLLGNGYPNDTGINGAQLFTGEQSYTVREIEVFAVDV